MLRASPLEWEITATPATPLHSARQAWQVPEAGEAVVNQLPTVAAARAAPLSQRATVVRVLPEAPLMREEERAAAELMAQFLLLLGEAPAEAEAPSVG